MYSENAEILQRKVALEAAISRREAELKRHPVSRQNVQHLAQLAVQNSRDKDELWRLQSAEWFADLDPLIERLEPELPPRELAMLNQLMADLEDLLIEVETDPDALPADPAHVGKNVQPHPGKNVPCPTLTEPQESKASEAPAEGACAVHPSTPSCDTTNSTPQTNLQPTPNSRPTAASSAPLPSPAHAPDVRWRNLTHAQRFEAAVTYAQDNGGQAVSLNLSIRRESAALHSATPLRTITKQINTALHRHGLADLPLALQIEVDRKTEKLHLHGVVIVAGYDVQAVKLALREGAGKVTDQGSAPRQLSLKSISTAAGWSDYCLKGGKVTDDAIGEPKPYLSHSMTARTRDWHDEWRRARPGTR